MEGSVGFPLPYTHVPTDITGIWTPGAISTDGDTLALATAADEIARRSMIKWQVGSLAVS